MTLEDQSMILLTGATGFIGGTILHHLLNFPALGSLSITCLVRGAERASILSSTYGDRVRPVVYKDLDDIEATVAVAAQHNLIISTTHGYHPASAQALLRGLAQRKMSTGKDVWMIHTSGTSNLADRPITGAWIEDREFDDLTDDIYGYEKQCEKSHPYPQRNAELGVIDSGLALGVNTLVIMPPLIWGQGRGLFNKQSVQIPGYIRSMLQHGCAVVVGDGKGTHDHVHVEDLAELYKICAVEITENGGKALPNGKNGIIFAGTGRHTWMDLAQAAANACYEKGKIADSRVEKVGLAEGEKILISQTSQIEDVELGLSSNSRTIASVAEKLGWKPTRGKTDWEKGFVDDLNAILENEKN